MCSEAKSLGLGGLVVYGTPGVIVLYRPAGGDDEREFLSAARKIGKKGGVTLRVGLDSNGGAVGGEGVETKWATGALRRVENALAESVGKRGKGLSSAGMEELKALVEQAGRGDQYRTVLGM